jgi:hypothetical protein
VVHAALVLDAEQEVGRGGGQRQVALRAAAEARPPVLPLEQRQVRADRTVELERECATRPRERVTDRAVIGAGARRAGAGHLGGADVGDRRAPVERREDRLCRRDIDVAAGRHGLDAIDRPVAALDAIDFHAGRRLRPRADVAVGLERRDKQLLAGVERRELRVIACDLGALARRRLRGPALAARVGEPQLVARDPGRAGGFLDGV